MKKAKIKETTIKKDNKKEQINNEISIKKIIIIVLSMLIILTGFYFLTEKILEKKEKETPKIDTVDVRKMNDINYSDVKNIKNDSYYLLLTKKDDKSNDNYDLFINSLEYNNFNYEFYYIDMDKEANKDLISEEEKLEDLNDIKVKDSTLIFVENGKIKDTYVSGDKILEHLMTFFQIETSEDNNDNSNSDSNEEKEETEKEETEKEDKE